MTVPGARQSPHSPPAPGTLCHVTPAVPVTASMAATLSPVPTRQPRTAADPASPLKLAADPPLHAEQSLPAAAGPFENRSQDRSDRRFCIVPSAPRRARSQRRIASRRPAPAKASVALQQMRGRAAVDRRGLPLRSPEAAAAIESLAGVGVSQCGARPCHRCGGSAGHRSQAQPGAMSIGVQPGHLAVRRRPARTAA